MADRVVLVLADGRTLAFDLEVYQSALVEGARLSGVPASPGEIASEPLLDAEQLAEQLAIPATWLEQKAREGVIPSLEFGRWRRFRRSEVEAAVRARRG